MQCGATQPDDELVKTKPVKTKPGKKINLPARKRSQRRKKKTEKAEKLNQGKEQFEGKIITA